MAMGRGFGVEAGLRRGAAIGTHRADYPDSTRKEPQRSGLSCQSAEAGNRVGDLLDSCDDTCPSRMMKHVTLQGHKLDGASGQVVVQGHRVVRIHNMISGARHQLNRDTQAARPPRQTQYYPV